MNPPEGAQQDEPSHVVDGERASALQVPVGGVFGPALVLTGFPHTPAGAVGQLAQIETTVLQTMSAPHTKSVYRAWALPGGTGPQDWLLTRSVESFLSRTAMGDALSPGATLVAEPVAALIKGTDGPDWVTVCVLVTITATFRTQAQVALGNCEAMQWVGGRWMLAPGRPAAPAPSTWPGTQLAHDSGWRTWESPTIR